MCVFAEQRALLLRLALGVWGIGGPGSVKRLLAWLGGLVEIERTGKGRGSCVRREDGGLKILLPHHLAEGWETAHCLLHELGHGLTTTTEWRTEGEAEDAAEDFRLAWILPRELVRGACRDSSAAVAQLAYSAGVGSDVICERVDWHLLHTPPDLTTVPPWSAYGHFRPQIRYTNNHKRIVVTGKQGEWFEWLCQSPADFATQSRDLHLALRALTPEEFVLKQAKNRTHCAPLEFPPLELVA